MDDKEKEMLFTVPPQNWFKNYFGFVPEPDDLLKFMENEPGAYDLFRKIWSNSYLKTSQFDEKHKGKYEKK